MTALLFGSVGVDWLADEEKEGREEGGREDDAVGAAAADV